MSLYWGNKKVSLYLGDKRVKMSIGSAGGDVLPDGYTQLRYIQSTGGQYINTGVKQDKLNIEMKCRPLNSENTYGFLLGARLNTNTNCFVIPIKNTSDAHIMEYGRISNTIIGNYYNQDVTISNKANVFTLNGVTKILSQYSFNSEYDVYLFTCNQNGTLLTRAQSQSRIYYLKMWYDDELVRNFIPVRNPDGIVGLYDTVSGTFFTNEGTGDFIAGPDVNSD